GELADPRHLYFSLTLRSPFLVRDRTGAACGRPERALLEPYAENLPAGLEFLPEASAVEWETWDGWAMAWGLPKPLVTALAPGSVLAYRAPAAERDAVLAFLREVEDRGLGERTAQGWGEAVACDPLHVTFDAE
ncbi:MAG: CRISPR-associated RAMP protein Csx10, partial [Desulfotomaculales bacterium]